MSTNKHATVRYHALDRCFSNYNRKFYIEDLIAACNEALYDYAGLEDGVKRRQVFDDITFMESDQGWSVQLDRVRDGRRIYYRYSEKSFSIKNQAVSQSEAEQLRETISILSRFKGLAQFEWIEEIQIRLEDTFKLSRSNKVVVGFEQNLYLKGLEHFTDLFNAVQHQKSLNIAYKGFRQAEPLNLTFHPWYLKQYNNRWFLFGFSKSQEVLSNLAIDRIIAVEESEAAYIPNKEIDFEEFFEDVVGVSVRPNKEVERIVIKVDKDVWPYIDSKPLHGSQKVLSVTEQYVRFELRVQINYELVSLVFSYMGSVEIIEPQSLRNKFLTISESIFKKYS